jgi:hypothetical protein
VIAGEFRGPAVGDHGPHVAEVVGELVQLLAELTVVGQVAKELR